MQPQQQQQPHPSLHLHSIDGSFVPKVIHLAPTRARTTIGRASTNFPSGEFNGFFDSLSVSRTHAEVWAEDGKIYIKDVESWNGTFVNGERLSAQLHESEPYELKSEDHVQFGIDVVAEDNKTIVHRKVSAKAFCIFRTSDLDTFADVKSIHHVPKPFQGVIVSFTGVQDQASLEAMAQDMGAKSDIGLWETVTHLVASTFTSDKYKAAIGLGLPILSPEWLKVSHATWVEGGEVELNQSVEAHWLRPFKDLRVCLTNFKKGSARDELTAAITSSLGTVHSELDNTISHLVFPSAHISSDKLDWAKRANRRVSSHERKAILIVREEWVWDCVLSRGRLDEEEYGIERRREDIEPRGKTHHTVVIAKENQEKTSSYLKKQKIGYEPALISPSLAVAGPSRLTQHKIDPIPSSSTSRSPPSTTFESLMPMDESGSKTDRRISFSLSAANVKPSTPSSSSSSSSKPWRAKAIFIAVLREGVNGLEGELALDAEGKGFYICATAGGEQFYLSGISSSQLQRPPTRFSVVHYSFTERDGRVPTNAIFFKFAAADEWPQDASLPAENETGDGDEMADDEAAGANIASSFIARARTANVASYGRGNGPRMKRVPESSDEEEFSDEERRKQEIRRERAGWGPTQRVEKEGSRSWVSDVEGEGQGEMDVDEVEENDMEVDEDAASFPPILPTPISSKRLLPPPDPIRPRSASSSARPSPPPPPPPRNRTIAKHVKANPPVKGSGRILPRRSAKLSRPQAHSPSCPFCCEELNDPTVRCTSPGCPDPLYHGQCARGADDDRKQLAHFDDDGDFWCSHCVRNQGRR